MTVLLLLLACAGAPSPDTAPDLDSADLCASTGIEGNPADLSGNSNCGEYWYDALCASCHGADGLGTDDGPDMRRHVIHHSDLELILVIRGGTGDMPPQPVDAQQTADLIAHLRNAFGEYDPTAP